MEAAKILAMAGEHQAYMVDIRRELHQHPELSGQEFETQKRIMRELDNLGIPYRKVGNTSLEATLNKGGGKIAAVRADIDALPIIEKNICEYQSLNEGVMHACGHDAHTAMLLGAARMLKAVEADLPGEVRLIFQEGEETFSGAKAAIADGVMEGVGAIFGLHNMPTLPSGQIEVRPGYKMAGCDTIYVSFSGVPGHGSMPHKAKDSFTPAALFALDLQNIVTKSVNCQQPVVLNVGCFHSGTKVNIVPKNTSMEISMRYFHAEARTTVHEEMRKRAAAIAAMYGVEHELRIEESALSLKNDDDIGLLAESVANELFGAENNVSTPLLMGSEDFPFYTQYAPGAYANLGTYNEAVGSVYFPHHDEYKVDEAIFTQGAAYLAAVALRYLEQ